MYAMGYPQHGAPQQHVPPQQQPQQQQPQQQQRRDSSSRDSSQGPGQQQRLQQMVQERSPRQGHESWGVAPPTGAGDRAGQGSDGDFEPWEEVQSHADQETTRLGMERGIVALDESGQAVAAEVSTSPHLSCTTLEKSPVSLRLLKS